jgi:quercetin dioxygenase-like cupin family protein
MRIDWSNLPAMPGPRPGTTRRAIAGHHLSAVRIVTEPGATFDGRLHRHDNEQLLVVLAGEIEVQIGEERITARPGDMVFFPPGTLHGGIGVGPQGAEFYEIFSPPRTDQLPGWLGPSAMEYG